jgi:RNA polymerase sigma factor (sigma-70 family)
MTATPSSYSEPQPGSDPGPGKPNRSRSNAETGGYGKYPARLLTAEEERVLAARIKAGDVNAREALIVANLRLVVHLAKRYRCSGTTIDDLIQEGTRGLIRAARDYDPQLHNTRFSSYAAYWIRNMIQRAIAANASLVRLPDYMFRLRNQFRQSMACQDIKPIDSQPLGIKLSTRRYQALLKSMRGQSPYALVGTEGEVSSLEEAIAELHQPDVEVDRAEAMDELHKALDRLTPMEVWVIRRRFGLVDPSESPGHVAPAASKETIGRRARTSYREVGRTLGISPLHVRKIEQIALQKLRRYLEPRVAPNGVLEA